MKKSFDFYLGGITREINFRGLGVLFRDWLHEQSITYMKTLCPDKHYKKKWAKSCFFSILTKN